MVNFPHSDHSDVAAINTHKPQPQFTSHRQVVKYWLPQVIRISFIFHPCNCLAVCSKYTDDWIKTVKLKPYLHSAIWLAVSMPGNTTYQTQQKTILIFFDHLGATDHALHNIWAPKNYNSNYYNSEESRDKYEVFCDRHTKGSVKICQRLIVGQNKY